MIKAHLEQDQLWRGRLYQKGDRLIPDDLAIALNLSPVDPLSTEEEPPPEPEKPKTRSRRKS